MDGGSIEQCLRTGPTKSTRIGTPSIVPGEVGIGVEWSAEDFDLLSIASTWAMPSHHNILRHTLSYFPNRPLQIDALAGEELSAQIVQKIDLVFLTDAVWIFSSQ